jgi:hypothetical protein
MDEREGVPEEAGAGPIDRGVPGVADRASRRRSEREMAHPAMRPWLCVWPQAHDVATDATTHGSAHPERRAWLVPTH